MGSTGLLLRSQTLDQLRSCLEVNKKHSVSTHPQERELNWTGRMSSALLWWKSIHERLKFFLISCKVVVWLAGLPFTQRIASLLSARLNVKTNFKKLKTELACCYNKKDATMLLYLLQIHNYSWVFMDWCFCPLTSKSALYFRDTFYS